MERSQDEAQQQQPLLIVISDTDVRSAELRSRTRTVKRWRSDDGEGFDGDPADAATYEWTLEAPSVTAVIDMAAGRARAVMDALRTVRPDAAVLVLRSGLEGVDGPRDGTLVRAGELRDVLRVDIEEELERLESERRAYCLREFAAGDAVVPIFIHPDPDPDAVSSALAIVTLLGGEAEKHPIVTFDPMTRPENRRMAELLHIRVTQITREELQQFERVITVDTQPRGLQKDGRPRVAVIDHHPIERDYDAEFFDVRPHYGATATMVTEYLRAAEEKKIGRSLATALLFGIRTDTDSLMRGVTPPDVDAYAFLQSRADVQLIRRFEKPSYSWETACAFGEALSSSAAEDDIVAVSLGQLSDEESHVLADLADFCLAIENVTWVIATAEIEGELIFTIRHTGTGEGAGALARSIAEHGGSGGGHATMARAVLPVERGRELLGGDADAPAVLGLVRRVMGGDDESVSRPDLHPAHQA